mgnify:CR=1 FL=1
MKVAGKALRSRKARQKTLGRKARRLSLPPKNKRDAGKASLRLGRLGLLGSHARTHRAIGFKASKSSPNRHVFRLHGRFRRPTSLGRRGFTAHPAVYSSTYMFNRTPAAGSAAHPSAHSTCVFGRVSKRTFNLCVIRAFRCAPNHTARPRNRPQLRQKVRSPGR